MKEVGEVSVPKGRELDKNNWEIERFEGKKSDTASGFYKAELRETPFSDSSDPFKDVFGGTENDSESDLHIKTKDSNIEEMDNGKVYDRESGKIYESVTDWEKVQETLAQRYDSVAKYWERKSEEERKLFQKADEREVLSNDDLDHYRNFQEYALKAKENWEKANDVRKKNGYHQRKRQRKTGYRS